MSYMTCLFYYFKFLILKLINIIFSQVIILLKRIVYLISLLSHITKKVILYELN